ncbi:MAG: ABC transporter ATP-binding protein [Clostridiales bacterium]|nr:ABC transporter ATP-binding protein [Clostridiales bacterium]
MAEERHLALSIKNITKIYGKKKAADHVSFDIHEGEIFGFLGPNGAGKTTVIKSILGFIFPDEGEVSINGYDTKKDYEKAMASVGGIVENPEMYVNLSARKNIEMYARIHGNIPKERIDEVINEVGLSGRSKDPIRKYSLGMKQRIGLAQAMVHKPKLLILDEPTNGLDPTGIHQLRDVLKKYAHEQKGAVMVSSHILSEMQLLCDRVGIINNGKLISVCTMEELEKMNSSSRYSIKVSDAGKAEELLKGNEKVSNIEVQDNTIKAGIEEEDIASVVRLLVTGGVDISEVRKNESSLEEVFLQVTGGGIDIE